MPRQHLQGGLGARERQILEVVYRLEEASVAQVRAELADAPSYSSVRTMIRLLEKKGLLRHRQAGTKYVYRPTRSRAAASRKALQDLLRTFFGGSATDAVAAILHASSAALTDQDLDRLEQLVDAARQQGK
jgi:BlaI family transcriptional regulator, penicillinase repressor